MPAHPNIRIAEHYRRLIRDGQLSPGDRLPSVRDLATEHGVATATVRNALSWLRIEGYIVTTQRGSFVAQETTNVSSPYDRLMRVRRGDNVLGHGESWRITAAEMIVPPLYVAELFDQDPGAQVVRREYVTGTGPTRIMLSVDWYPAYLGELVPSLLSSAPGSPDPQARRTGLLSEIEQATGRTPTVGRDAMHARIADHREARHLGIAVGAPILAGAHEWSDDEGVILYGEWCLPQKLTIGYEYQI